MDPAMRALHEKLQPLLSTYPAAGSRAFSTQLPFLVLFLLFHLPQVGLD
jgi:hypothetical protein